jgi:hypothetical protein
MVIAVLLRLLFLLLALLALASAALSMLVLAFSSESCSVPLSQLLHLPDFKYDHM